MRFRFALVFLLLFASAVQAKTVKQDYFIDAVDPGIKLFVRGNMAEGQAHFTDAPAKKHVVIGNATHFVLFEKPRFEFFNEIVNFLKEQP